MATEYVAKLSTLLRELKLQEQLAVQLEVRHFFNGAALYANETICASWSPVGLAFRLSEEEASALIASGEAKPLKYFAKGHVKRGYALFEKPEDGDASRLTRYFIKAAQRTG